MRVTRSWQPATRTLRLTVDQTQTIDATHPLFRFPATIRVVTRDSVVRHDIMVDARHQTFDLRLPDAPQSFRFDEGGWLLGTVTTDQTVDELAALARHDLDFTARYWALTQLDSSTSPVAREARRLIALNDPNQHMRGEAIRQLGYDASPLARELVRAALQDPSGGVRASAVQALARRDSAGAQATIVALAANDPSAVTQIAAISVYDPRVAPEGTALLVDRLRNGGALSLRSTAAQRLLLRPDAAGLDALEAATNAVEPRELRTQALGILARWPDRARAIAVASRSLTDGDPLFAVAAARQLGAIGGDAGRATLQQALGREQRVTVRAAITQALAPRP